MPRIGRFTRELRARLWKPPVDEEVRSELDAHLEMLEQDLIAQGMDPAAARTAARAKFGDVARIGDSCREIGEQREVEQRRAEWMGELRQDVRYAVRQLRANPRFTLVAVLTLAVGLGAATTIFGLANAVIIRPLPFHEPERLVLTMETTPTGRRFSVSEPNFLDWQRRARSFDGLAAFAGRSPSIRGDGEPEQLQGVATTRTLFGVLGVAPAIGRTFTAEEDAPGGDARVAVISDALWQRRFGADPRIIDRSIDVDGVMHRVVGVMPRSFDFPGRVDIWVPLVAVETYPRGDRRLEAIGRLAPGATAEQAATELAEIGRQLAAEYPASNKDWGTTILPFSEWYVSPQLRARVMALLATVGLLLVMACVNVASLLLARAGTREREMAVRAALGAGRGRIVRQLLTESMVLSMIGAIVGVALAMAAVPVLRRAGGTAIPRLDELSLDWRVMAFALAACITTGLVFGLAPALRMARTGGVRGRGDTLNDVLRSGVRVADGGRLRSTLIISSVALAMLLLVSAGLVGGSFLRLTRVDLGFAPERVLTASLVLPSERYDPERVAIFHEQLGRRLAAIPGVRAAGATNIAPFSGGNTAMGWEVAGRETGVADEYRDASWRSVTRGYFASLGIPLQRGRLFEPTDVYPNPQVIVINETLARLGWPNGDPIGGQLKLKNGRAMTVVGVVGDTRALQLDSLPWPTMYFSHGQFPWPSMWLTLRATGDPTTLVAALRREVHALDPTLALARVQPLTQLVSEQAAEARLTMLVFAIFASAALVLAAIGLYGIISYTVSQRTREIGVRLALGAPPRGIVRAVLGHGVRLAVAGVAIGGIAAYGVAGLLRAILYETEPTDAATYAAVALLLLVVAGLASVVPARRAARLDPVMALRVE